MSLKLSEGSLELIMTGVDYDEPIMQVLASKRLVSSNSSERYRLLISDGKYHNSFAMVATQLNDLIANGELTEFTVVKIKKYITTIFHHPDKDRRVMVILDVEILKKGNEVGIRIGNPTNFDGTTTPAPSKPGSAATSLSSSSSTGASALSSSSNSSSINTFPQGPSKSVPTNTSKPSGNSYMNQMKISMSNAPIHPISSLNPYQNKWSIKARVTSKQAPRTYVNARGEGKLFSVVFTDESGEIKCTGFNNIVDKLSDLLEVNKVYIVSNCSIKTANKKFTQADYEMTFTDDSIVTPCSDDVGLPTTKFNFIPIAKVADMDVESIIDVIGVAKSASEVQTLVAKSTGKELKKREVLLVDQSNNAISLTLWGTQAVEFDGSKSPVVAAKSVRVSEFMGGKSISLLMSSTLQIDPDIPEAHRLRGWFDNGGVNSDCVSISAKPAQSGGLSNWVRLGEMASQGLGLGDKADYFSGIVNVLMAKSDNCVYKACPGTDCKKKVMDMNNGQYRCEKCNRDYDHFTYRMLLSVQVSDYTGSTWVTLFHEEAQKLLGADAQVIGAAIDNKDESYKEYFANMNFKKFQMKFRTKMESYNDEKRLKTTVVSVDPVDYKVYARRLIEQFKEKAGMVTKPC